MAHPLRKPRENYGHSPNASVETIGSERASREFTPVDVQSRTETGEDRGTIRRFVAWSVLSISLLLALSALTGHLLAGALTVGAAILFAGLLFKWGAWVLDNTPAC